MRFNLVAEIVLLDAIVEEVGKDFFLFFDFVHFDRDYIIPVLVTLLALLLDGRGPQDRLPGSGAASGRGQYR